MKAFHYLRPAIVKFVFALLLFICCLATVAQTSDDKVPAIQVDEFGLVGDCDFGGRLDAFLAELSRKQDHQGYIIDYGSAEALPGDRESFRRERTIRNHIVFRRFDASRITIVRGGYRPEWTTELWLVPPNAEPPQPSRTVPEPTLPETKTFLYGKKNIYFGDVEDAIEDPLNEFVLPSVKERERSEAAARQAEMESGDEAETAGEIAEATEEESGAEEDKEPIDERTKEQKREERFSWANTGVGRLLASRKEDDGLLIFYADDQRYDVEKLRRFVEEARDLLAEHAPVEPTRFRIEFGGYRHQPEVEFWVVSKKGTTPVATPDERPVEEPETPEN